MRSFAALSPGRLCLFGEHQDYLGFPVIALALPLHCRIEVTPTESSRILVLRAPQLDLERRYDLDNLPPRQSDIHTADFALSAIHEVLDAGWELSFGATCLSTTEIPLQAGCSSSTAFCVAWILVLAKLAGKELQPLDVARMAHRAEVTHFGAPGGTMDHVTIAVGGSCLRIGPGMWEVQELQSLSKGDGVWVLAFSGAMKDTIGHLKRCKDDRLELLQIIGSSWDADVKESSLTENQKELLRTTRINRRTEQDAFRVWNSNEWTEKESRLGSLMDEHHRALRDGLKLSTSTLEAIRSGALAAGAWGYKLVGSGGGGCAVAWTRKDCAREVEKAMLASGATQCWVIEKPDQGACIIETSD